MRKFVSKLLYGVVFKIITFLPMRNIIIFESNPDYACNTYPVFLKIKKAYPKYKCVWVANKKSGKHPLADDVFYYDDRTVMNTLKRYYYRLFAKAYVCCNKYMVKYRDDQISLFLTHGSKTKKTRGIYEMGDKVDYVTVQSHFFDDIICYEYNLKPEQLVYLGYPRNDYFFNTDRNINECLGLNEKDKYIIWLPTFRKKTSGWSDADSCYSNFGIPLIYNCEILNAFNEYLKKNNLFVIYKPHPAQDVSALKASSMSNLRIIDDKYLSDSGLQLSEVLAKSEGLITDYSSVFFDYLLLDKPIGTTTDDIEQWKSGRGFAFDLEAMYDESTVRIPNYECLIEFLNDILDNYDEKKLSRREVCKLTNIHYDGDSAERVVSFLMEKIEK